MRDVSVGLIGYGFASSVFHAPLVTSIQGLNLRRITSHNPDAVHADYPSVQVDSDSKAIFDDPDIELVIIATPNTSHYVLARDALLAGKHVVLDKPFVVSLDDGVELIRLAQERERLLSVFHNRRWDNDFLTVKQCIASGLLGTVCSYEGHYDRFVPNVDGRWREQPTPGSGVLFDLGSHLIDQALHLFGLPHAVTADVSAQRPLAKVDDYFHLCLDYGALKVILHASMLVRESGPHYQVHGNTGSFIKYGFDSQEDALIRGERPGHPRWGRDNPAFHGKLSFEAGGLSITSTVETLPGRYQSYYRGMYAAIVNNEPSPVGPVDALNVIKVIEYALQSHREQRTITFR